MTLPREAQAPVSPLARLQKVLGHHNAGAAADSQITLDLDGRQVTLCSKHGAETFVLSEETLYGRGGPFFLPDESAVYAAVAAVLPFTTGFCESYGLTAHLAAHGFTLQAGQPLRWKYQYWMTPLRAVHPDGRVVWFRDFDEIRMDDSLCRSLDAGGQWLSCVYDPTEAELLCLMELSDEELQADGLDDIVPRAVSPKVWRVSDQALDILVREAEQGFMPGAPVSLPWLVPPDFFDRAEEFVVSEVVFTRAMAREQRTVREKANASLPGKRRLTLSKVPEDLPF
ncbi:hypothetical protein [Deinococcus ruber]|uniref:Uncharacterized protein n=1 Tax=Deinococcus ruber TaxID=1848197 RepID=A0A918F509_9DEIO|nr:hypothetical protein [Deinococcus ruber]GGR09363.1 hypothetical protein GCM10008957_22590 [Deinococcus ruber]